MRCAEARALFAAEPVAEAAPDEPEAEVFGPIPRCCHCGGLLAPMTVDDWLMTLDDRQWHAEIAVNLPWEDL